MPHDHLNAPKRLGLTGETVAKLSTVAEADQPAKFNVRGVSKVSFEAVTVCAFCPFVGRDAHPLPTKLSSQEKLSLEDGGGEAK